MSGLKGMSKAQIQEAGRLADEQRLRYQQVQREQPVDSLTDRINAITQNMKDYWSEGTDYGKLLKAYGDVMAPINESLLKGMKMPYKENKEAIQKRERANLPEMRPAGQLTPFTQSMTDPNYRFIAEIGADPLNLAGAPAVGRLAKKGVQATATSLAPKAGQMAGQFLERQGLGPLSVVKKEGGNWILNNRGGVDSLKNSFSPERTEEQLASLGFSPREIEQNLKEQSINKYINTNLSNYVKNKMATPSDPVRLGIEERVRKAQETLTNKLENNLQARRHKLFDAKESGADPRDIANLERDVVRYEAQIRQEYDDALKLASHIPLENPNKMRAIAQMGERSRANIGDLDIVNDRMATTDLSKLWEDLSDSMVEKSVPSDHILNNGRVSNEIIQNPWISKLPSEAEIYSLQDSGLSKLKIDHAIDVLKAKINSGELKPNQLPNLSVDGLLQMTAKYDKEMADKISAAKAAARAGLPVHKEYPEGYRWIELNKPGSFAAESEAMGHSVVGYEPYEGHPDWVKESGVEGDPSYGLGGWDAIKSGKAKVYSLVDSKGAPHATIEVAENPNPYPVSGESFARLDPATKAQYREHVMQWRRRNPDIEELTDEHTAQALKEAGLEPQPPLIKQIKGKGNDALIEDYVKYGQDFVKSGKWSDVRDLENVGMYHVNKPEVLQKYGSPYLTQEEFDEATPLIYQTPDMKSGGQVKDCGCHANMDAQRLAVWDKAERRGIGGRMAGKGARLLIPAMRPMDEVKMALELAQKSRARELQEAAGLYHGVGANLKTSKPVELMKARVIPNKKEPLVPEKRIGWEDIPLGSSIFSPPWDLSGVGTLTHVGGNKLSKPVTLQGGQLYQRTHAFPDSPELSSYTASQQGVVTRLGNLVRKHAEEGKDIFSIPMTMGHQGSDFNTMMTEAVLNQMDLRDLPESLKKELAHEIRTRVPNAKKPEIVPGKDFVGFDDPDLLRQQLLDPDSGELRKVFVNRLGLKQFQKSGQLPDIPETRFGIADPRLVNAPLGVSAFDISKVNPEGIMVPKQRLPHKTFKAQGSGEYFGTFDQGDLVKFQELYPEFIQGLRERGKPTKDDWYTFGRSIPVKKFDQELLDSIKEATGANAPSVTEYQDGGAIRKGGGGFMAKQLAKRLAPEVLPIAKKLAPQEAALLLAQKNAVPMGQSANQSVRMLQQGFEPGWYHGGTGDIKKFRSDLLGEATNAPSAKKAFFFARDPQNPPAHLTVKTLDPESIALLKKLGKTDKQINELNKISMKGHGAETASGYANIGGSREYREATRKAKAAENRGDWDEYEKQSLIAEDSEIKRMQEAQSLVAKYGDARDSMTERINQTFYSLQHPQAQAELLDKKYKELMPYGWYNNYTNQQFNNLKNQLTELVGKDAAIPALNEIDKFKAIRAERIAAEKTQEGGNVMPVALSYKNPLVHDFEGSSYRDETYSDLIDKATRGGHDALILKNTYDPAGGESKLIDVGAVFDPDQIRSRNAAFDPFRRDAATAAAMGVAAPDLLASEGDKKAKGGKVKKQVSLDAMRLAVLNKQSKDKRYG